MEMTYMVEWARARWMPVLVVGWMLLGRPAGSLGQEGSPPPPLSEPPRSTTPATDAQQELLDRLRRMEQRLDQVTTQNADLARENQSLAAQVQDLSRRMADPGVQGGLTGGVNGSTSSGMTGATRDSAASSGRGGMPPATSGGGSASGGGDPTTTGRAQVVGNRRLGRIPLLGGTYDFDNDGFRWGTGDDEITFGVRALQQLDARIYANSNQEFASSGIFNPRTRFYFEGNLTRPISYEFSFQQTYATLNLLDSYLNYRFSDGFQLRLGRYKTPFTYEWYRVHVWHLLAPERSLFATNFEGNRRFGFMGWGSLFENRLEYAVGSFDGQRNSYLSFNSHQDIMAFLNFKPFEPRTDSFLQNLQFGGSVNAGIENNPLSPAVLTTSAPPAATSTLSPGSAQVPFLAFNNGVVERGFRALWELHMAYYYQGLSLLGAWDSGFQHYAQGSSGPPPVRVPTSGYFVQAGYILTGETIRDRTLIDPLRPFDLRPGQFGLGALELTARYSELSLGQSVFNGGLADPNLWTNHARMVDVGFNWYLNKFVKVYFDWEHAMFGTPIFYNTGRFQKSNDLYWLRFQVYF
jgi:phosphate-selective porin OprO/OprP